MKDFHTRPHNLSVFRGRPANIPSMATSGYAADPKLFKQILILAYIMKQTTRMKHHIRDTTNHHHRRRLRRWGPKVSIHFDKIVVCESWAIHSATLVPSPSVIFDVQWL